MRHKIFCILILTVSFTIGYSQIKHSDVKSNALLIHVFSNKDSVSSGTGFICKYKGNLYLLTTYELLTNRQAEDTAGFATPKKLIPTRIEVRFQSKSRTYYIIDHFSLFNP